MFKYLSDYETHKIGFRETPSGKLSGCYCYLPLSDVLVSITDNEICLQHFPKMVQLPNWTIELRMLTMLFSQAVRTGHEYLSKTPWEVLEEILALTARPGIAYKLARKVVRDHIGWPRIRHY
uniref:Uncharacterized protein n=1 Tax=Ditylenchus dipsaci TaxID=166011 RepID=A0A915ERS1_9BILA